MPRSSAREASGRRLQVTYAGKALYWFYEDSKPNQVKGDVKDKWGTWSVVTTSMRQRFLAARSGDDDGSHHSTGEQDDTDERNHTDHRQNNARWWDHSAQRNHAAQPDHDANDRAASPDHDGTDDHPHDLAYHDDHVARWRWRRRHRLLTLDRDLRGRLDAGPPVVVSRWWPEPARRAPTSPRAIATAPTRSIARRSCAPRQRGAPRLHARSCPAGRRLPPR